MGEETKKGFTITGQQLVIGIAVIAAVWFGGKWALSAGVGYIRSQVRAEVIQVISDISGGKINLDDKKGDGGKKLIPFLGGDETGE